ncbi:hypothetical protein SteCoe_19950 [Stentor coeruleus]|uniref:G-protein coupled receptors family 2 profile 2 domain-containing protein n=1 Tax=Stentor coeruleus TaxID=5963 RepID=A0A1R2BSX2_9CILI|nr:hypothetical protein SteCoe_19950 [Stentor coeruleus]
MYCGKKLNEDYMYYCNIASGSIGLLGSLSILLSYLIKKPLRTASNNLISSLALSQLFLGSLSILLSYLIKKPLRTASNNLISSLALSQLIACLTFFIPNQLYKITNLCKILSIIYNSIQLITITWAFAILYILNKVLVKSNTNIKKHVKFLHIFSWIIIPALHCLPIITNSIESDNEMCTYTNDIEGNIWRLCLFYIPAWSFIILAIFLYFKIYIRASKLEIAEESKEFIQRMIYYPIIVVGFLIPLSVVRLLDAVIDCDITWLMMVSVCLMGLQGFFDAIVFFTTLSVKAAFRRKSCVESEIENRLYFLPERSSSLTWEDY